MKKTLLVLLLSSLLFSISSTAQNWLTSGNALGANGTLGSTTNFSVVFKSNNSERGRLTNSGLWGFGTTAPNSKVHINSASGQTPLRVQVNASTKFLVHSGGGVSIGSSSTPPVNGLFVSGNIGVGTSSPSSRLDVAGSIIGFDSYFNSTSGFHGISLGRSGGSYGSIGYGLTFTGTSNTYQYRVSDFSSMLNFNAGGFDFNTAPSGSTGNIITYTTAMKILPNGNVGIGTNTPGNRLNVTAASTSIPIAFIENTGGSSVSDGLHIKAGSNTAVGSAYFIVFRRPDGTHLGRIWQNTTNSITYLTTSDKHLKNIIGASKKGLSELMKINIYDYTFKTDPEKKVQTGFMAQELYEVFPQSVSKPGENNEPAEKNPWMADYGSVTPLIIKSVQEQQQIIVELKEKIAAQEEHIAKLQAAVATIIANNNGNTSTVITDVSLEQNKPNPFNKNTTIRYSIPQGSKGQISIYDQAGKLVKMLNANAGGQSQVSGHDLPAGTYTYTLMINGKVASSKKMLIIK